jgi:predicted nucleotidyltransferase component of viral defense system
MSESTPKREQFLLLPDEERKEILQTKAAEKGQNPSILEKDVWVCWALKTLFEIPHVHPMAFKGGTLLSKVFGVIARFSEDIDVTFDYKALNPSVEPFKEGLSNSQRKELASDLRNRAIQYTNATVLPAFKSEIKNQFGDNKYGVQLSNDGESLAIHYSPLFQGGYLRDRVVIEFGGRNSISPSKPVKVTATIAGDLPSLVFPEASVVVLAAERTFWEKATLIHELCNSEKIGALERQCRHWFDLYQLCRSTFGENALKDRELLEDVVRHKTVFFYSAKARYGDCVKGSMRLVPNPEMTELEADYKKMQEEGMFEGSVPSFREMLEEVKKLEGRINEGLKDKKA